MAKVNDKERYQKYKENYLQNARKWQKQNPEKVKTAQKRYRQKHPDRVRKATKKWREKNKEKMKLWKSMTPTKQRQYARTYRKKLRTTIINLLGGKCVKCGESDWRCLQIDHIHGGGNKERKKKFLKDYGNYLRYVLRQVKAGSKDYQLLCANCNWKKKYDNNENSHPTGGDKK